MVFVLDKHKCPLMPCSEKRARLLLERKRAVIHRRFPFVIRLKDRLVEESSLQPVVIKIDPGSQVTGMAVVREEETQDGCFHHALHLSEVRHRGKDIHDQMQRRAKHRRRRRGVNLRYRQPRFLNRRRSKGWLAPSLQSRVDNIKYWVRRYSRWVQLSQIELEFVKFDTQRLQNPEIQGMEYQHGTLAGWEVREYLLEKWQYSCAYCKATGVPLELDHVYPRSRGGSDRVSNLAPSCCSCNQVKGNQTAAEFGHPEVEAQIKKPLKDAAAVTVTRWILLKAIKEFGLPVNTWSGGRTRWNRQRFGISKTHALDALCVGNIVGVSRQGQRTLMIAAQGRGTYGRTNVDKYGFPRGYFMRKKSVRGFKTGDMVEANIPAHLKNSGVHRGKIGVRATGKFCMGKIQYIAARHCRLLHRADGYIYTLT